VSEVSEKRRQYTDEFKREAVRLVTEKGYGVTEQQTTGRIGGNGPMSAEHDELLQLRKEVKRLRMEREILKQAALFFANESN
jgi:transposase